MCDIDIRDDTSDGRTSSLLEFLAGSPTAAHSVEQTRNILDSNGFKELKECNEWALRPGDRFYVVRSGTSIVAGILGMTSPSKNGFRIVGAHTDAPGFRVKPDPERTTDSLTTLGVEVYGGPILSTWFDRDLGIAGKLVLGGERKLETRLFDLRRPLCRMTTPAVHLNRTVNKDGFKVNEEENLPPILTGIEGGLDRLLEEAAVNAGIPRKEIVAWSMEPYDIQPPTRGGLDNEFIFAGRIDNVAMCHAALEALLASGNIEQSRIIALFDNEEVGSMTVNGAGSGFIGSILERLCSSRQQMFRALARSISVSADGAHAVHPNYADKHDRKNRPRLNGGPVIKINAREKYTTTPLTSAYFLRCAKLADVEVQTYVNRSDMPCGTTIGPITAARTGIATVDVGNPMLSMHSVREMAGVKDHSYMVRVLEVHLNGAVEIDCG